MTLTVRFTSTGVRVTPAQQTAASGGGRWVA